MRFFRHRWQDAFPSNVVDVRKLAKSLSWEHLRQRAKTRRMTGHLFVSRQALENAPLLVLMTEYLKLNFQNDTVRRGRTLGKAFF